jgi:hypothetical protein
MDWRTPERPKNSKTLSRYFDRGFELIEDVNGEIFYLEFVAKPPS